MDGLEKKIETLLAAAFSAGLFYAIWSSEIAIFLKAILSISLLLLSGMLLQKLTGLEGYYGLLILRGKRGLGIMETLAKQNPEFWRNFCDFGLSLGFGLPYGWMLFSKKPRKFLLHASLIAILAAIAFALPLFSSELGESARETATFSAIMLSAVFFLGGLAFLGFTALFKQTLDILTIPNAPAGVMLIIPGITVPWHWIIALIIAIAVHEIAHGILSKVEGLEIKTSGGILLGFLPIGAFVEPDEEKFKKIAIMKKQRILVAGTATNFATALLFGLLFSAASIATPLFAQGVQISSVSNTSIAARYLSAGDRVETINGKPIQTESQLASLALSREKLENLSIKTNSTKTEISIPATELIIAAVTNTTSSTMQCNGLSKINPAHQCFFIYPITCGAASIACPPPAKQVPASNVLAPGDTIIAIDGEKVSTVEQLRSELSQKKPGAEITLQTSRGEKKLTLDENGKMGVQTAERLAITFKEQPREGIGPFHYLFALLLAILSSTATLNLALSIINLLPLFITDGSRIIYEELMFRLKEPYEEKGKKTLSAKITLFVSIVTVALLLANLVLPNLK